MTPEKAAFMIRYTSGVLCVPCTEKRLQALQLPLMVEKNTDSMKTAYTITVDHKETSTGISAADRSLTISRLANPTVLASEFNKPGHVFPLAYRQGGVLVRPGHTEASVDFCKLSGKEPVAAIAEVVLDNGQMARRTDLMIFAKNWRIKLVTIQDLIAYRKKNDLFHI
jgi:3,4-dihydroxy-2-butanone 4-phosphate synthase